MTDSRERRARDADPDRAESDVGRPADSERSDATHRAASRAGFTLVEVIVAMAIVGMVIAAAYGIVGAVADARSRTIAARGEILPGPAARAALDAWLRGTGPVEGAGPFEGIDRGEAYLPDDVLSFGVEDGGALHPGPRRIRLWVERRPGFRSGLLAELAPLRTGGEDGTDTLVLAPAAAGLSARYRTRIRGVHTWVSAWKSDSVFPDAVELVVHPAPQAAARADAGGLPRVLRLPIVAPLHANTDDTDARGTSRPAGVRPPCDPLGADPGQCPGG